MIVLLAAGLNARDIKVSAFVDRNEISPDDMVSFTIQIEGTSDFPNIPPPESPDFVIVAGPSQSSSIQIINGRMNASKSVSWELAPTRSGQLVIPSVSVQYERRVYKTDPVVVNVSKKSPQTAPIPQQRQNKPSQPSAESQKADVFIRAVPSSTVVFKGEEVDVSFVLYFQNVRTFARKKLPDAKGFWLEEFPVKAQPDISTETVDGVAYKKAVVQRLALFPITSGKLVIDPFVVDCEVVVPAPRRRSIFDDFFDDSFFDRSFRGTTQIVSVASKPVWVTVKDLPESGKPSNFTGAVGKFSIVSSIDTLETTEDQAVTLRYKVSGTGNINSLKLLPVEFSNTVEAFEPKIDKKINYQGDAIQGTVTYEYVLIPRSAGLIRIPSLSFSYFDPGRNGYVSATARGFDIKVNPKDIIYASDRLGLSKEEVFLLGQDIRFIRRDASSWNKKGKSVLSAFWFWMINSISVFLVFGAIGFRWWTDKMETNIAFASKRRAWSKAQKGFALLDEKLKTGNRTDFFSMLNQTLVGYISDRLGLPQSGIGAVEIEEKLKMQSVDPEILARIHSIFAELEKLRFLPGAVDTEKFTLMLQEAKDLVSRLSKVI